MGFPARFVSTSCGPSCDGVIGEEYYGSLTKETVLRYETRIEEITDQVEELDVEGLKGKVLCMCGLRLYHRVLLTILQHIAPVLKIHSPHPPPSSPQQRFSFYLRSTV